MDFKVAPFWMNEGTNLWQNLLPQIFLRHNFFTDILPYTKSNVCFQSSKVLCGLAQTLGSRTDQKLIFLIRNRSSSRIHSAKVLRNLFPWFHFNLVFSIGCTCAHWVIMHPFWTICKRNENTRSAALGQPIENIIRNDHLIH